ncbi:hypothetical protein WJX82_001406 [Trebouxia sp. C0006]
MFVFHVHCHRLDKDCAPVAIHDHALWCLASVLDSSPQLWMVPTEPTPTSPVVTVFTLAPTVKTVTPGTGVCDRVGLH